MADAIAEHDELSSWLLGRDEAVGAWIGATRLKRLGSASEYGYRTDAAVRLDRAKMLIHGVCTSERMDRSREVVRAKGLDVADHRLNPIFTLCHGWKSADGIIGRTEIGNEYAVKPGAGNENSTPFSAGFFQTGPNKEKAYQAFELADSGVLKGVSIGFTIGQGGQQRITATDGYPALELTRTKLFEVTLLPVGDNPDAVVRVVEKGLGGKRLGPDWLAMLKPFIPPKRASVVSGYREKTMTGLDTQTDPAGQQQDPNQQPPLAEDPIKQPGAKGLFDLNTFAIGLLKLVVDMQGQHDSPHLLTALPQIQLHLSRILREIQTGYTGAQGQFPDLPPLPGGGSAMLAEPDANPLAELGALGDAATDPDPLADGLGDGLGDDPLAEDDGGELFADLDDDDSDVDDDGDDDEPTKKKKAAVKEKRLAARTARAWSERRLDAYWDHFAATLDATDQLRLKGLVAILGRVWAVIPADARKELRGLTPWLREKAFGGERRPANDSLQTAILAAVDAELAPIRAGITEARDGLYQLTGK